MSCMCDSPRIPPMQYQDLGTLRAGICKGHEINPCASVCRRYTDVTDFAIVYFIPKLCPMKLPRARAEPQAENQAKSRFIHQLTLVIKITQQNHLYKHVNP
ncbi:hypothetical protein HMI54_013518 [Coelomomyces lativittatus]|nr:hypothetical protein HMI54_013518 [Coelomomyces lativittatus]